jgi:hypothetical protein
MKQPVNISSTCCLFRIGFPDSLTEILVMQAMYTVEGSVYLQGIISQKIELLVVIAVRLCNPVHSFNKLLRMLIGL